MVAGAIAATAADAYDAFAFQYDHLLEENRINAYMRRAVTAWLRASFGKGDRLLELGCGTGDDALAMADLGCEVFAFDPSAKMIELASLKAGMSDGGHNARFLVGQAKDLPSHPRLPPGLLFDGAYANFSLSYEPDLRPVSHVLSAMIRPGGRLLIASMNRLCAAELLAAALTGRFRLAGRRLSRRTLHKVGDSMTWVFPRSPKEVVDALQDHFRFEDIRALPAIVPPHYANRILRKWPAALDLLTELDPSLGSLPILRSFGDHHLVRFRRKDSAAPDRRGQSSEGGTKLASAQMA